MDLFRLDLVLFLYTFLNVFLDNTIAIRLERGPSNVTANVGDTILLICDVIDNSENTVLWYNKNKHMFISEEDRVYNFDKLPRNYDVLHNRDASSYTLRITDATTENAGWYECGFRNSLNHYESFEAAAYVMVSDPRQPPSPMLSPPVCRVTELPRVRVGEFEVDVDCSWVSPGTGDNVRAALFFNDVQLEPNVTLQNRVISRIPSPQSQQNRIVCGVGLENTAIIVNSTCQIVSNQIARVRIDPLVNNVYKGNVADFNCSIDGHGNNRIDITIVKDERNLSTERSSDTLNVQFVPVLQENNTVLECVASDLPGNTVRTVSFLRVLSALTTTEKVTTAAAISITTSTPAVTQTPLPITREHLSLIFIILIIMAIVIALFSIFALVGVFARRHRRKLWISEKSELESVPPVDLVESRIILTELCDEASEDNSANDVPAYAASKLPDPDADSHLPSNLLPIVTYRRSSLPENVLKSTGSDDLSMFRSRKQSEPFVVYARPNNFQKMAANTVLECNRAYESLEEIAPYAKPNKLKIRKWASQGAAVFQERSATVHGEGSEPFPVYAKPNKSSISLNRAETLKPFPHYAKPEIKERKYLSQRVCKSSAPLNKTRKFMSLSKEREDPAMPSSIGGYSEVRAAGHHGHGDEDEMPQYAESTRRVLAREARSKSIPNAASAIRVLPPSPRYADPINVCTSPGFHQSEPALNAESAEISQERPRIPPSAGMADSQDSLYESMPDGLGSIDGLRPATTLMRHDDDDCSKLSDYQMISESNIVPTKQLEAGIDTASNTECNELIQSRFGHCTDHAPDTQAEVNRGDEEMTENPLYEMSRLKQIL